MKRIEQILCGSLLSILVCIFAQQLDAEQAPTTPTPGLLTQLAQISSAATQASKNTPTTAPSTATQATPIATVTSAAPAATAASGTNQPSSTTSPATTSGQTPTVPPAVSPVQTVATAIPTGIPSTVTAPIATAAGAPSGAPSATTNAPAPSAATGQPSQQGITIKNPTQYPATITLHITPSNQIVQKDVAPGQTVTLFDQALNKTDTYTVSGSLFRTVITKTTVTTLSGAPQATAPAEFITTKTNRLSSAKNWSSNASNAQKIELTIKFTETPGAEPIFEIQQQ